MKVVIQNQITFNELEKICYSDNQQKIYWEDEGKEFLFNRQMYDVVNTKVENGKTILYCVKDKKEKEIIDRYNLITKNNSSAGKKAKAIVDNTFNLFVYQNEKNNVSFAILHLDKYFPPDTFLSNGIEDTVSPPPKA
ncbi:MAG: hypothetical protein M3004_14125 [Bacteroidota bacterium]|nr:hypothetical protein [Bacteroidota bacterium]